MASIGNVKIKFLLILLYITLKIINVRIVIVILHFVPTSILSATSQLSRNERNLSFVFLRTFHVGEM